MRLVAVIFCWLVLVGGLALYMQSRKPAAAVGQFVAAETAANYHLLINSSFALTSDPFALTATEEAAEVLMVILNGKIIYRAKEIVQSEEAIKLEKLALVKGRNEIYLKANNNSGQSGAMRLRLYREAELVVEKTFWSEMGGQLVGTLNFDSTKLEREEDEDEH